jgi:hypothetical protein
MRHLTAVHALDGAMRELEKEGCLVKRGKGRSVTYARPEQRRLLDD